MKYNFKKLILITFSLFFLFSLFNSVHSLENSEKVTIYYFYGDGCPYCIEQNNFFNEMIVDYPEVEIIKFETWRYQSNVEVLENMGALIGEDNIRGVPITFINEQMFVGFNDRIANSIISNIEYCIENDCRDLGEDVIYNPNYVEVFTIDDVELSSDGSFNYILLSLIILISIFAGWYMLRNSDDEF